MGLFVYLMDRFYELSLGFDELVRLYDEDPLKVFELIKPLVEEKVGKVSDVRLYNSFLGNETALIEYMVKTESGKIEPK